MSRLPQIDGVSDLSEIGRGGFGVVFRGTETEFHRDVAVKVLMPTLDERARKRFERERRAMGAVSNHPNIVTVYRGGLTPTSQPYLVMEYLSGGSLADRLDQVGPLDWRTAADIGGKLADALTTAHRAGILHRDLKPGNVFMTEHGEPKLGDFGIARLEDGQDSRTGSITASIAHAPPEIIDGERGDERSDLYSLASTVYALTNGAAPFSRGEEGLAPLLSRITNNDPSPLHLESAANEFQAAIFRALSKHPNDRHDTVAQFGNELRRAAAAPITAPLDLDQVDDLRQPADIAAPVQTRSTNLGQLMMLGALALLIAGFGGWAVARAVFGANAAELVQASPTPTAVREEPTAVQPTAEPAPTAVPAPTVAPPPLEPTAIPTTTAPTPTPAGGGGRGSNFGEATIAGFTRISDFSGTITVDVPDAWALEVHDSSEIPLEESASATVRILAAGGSLQALSGDPEIRDLDVPGIYIFAARLSGPVETAEILDGALDLWSDCEQGPRSQILLADGNAHFQILECDKPSGGTAGVITFALVPDADSTIAVTLFLQLADIGDVEVLDELLGTLRLDLSQLPAAPSDS